MVGTQVGNYRIEELLGEGGMGTVYRALETQLDRRVAIKVLNADLARNPLSWSVFALRPVRRRT